MVLVGCLLVPNGGLELVCMPHESILKHHSYRERRGDFVSKESLLQSYKRSLLRWSVPS